MRNGAGGSLAFLGLVFGALMGCASSVPRRHRAPRAPQQQLREIERLLGDAARRHGVEPALVRGVIHVESGFRVNARSSVGARGLMQLMPRTAEGLARQLRWESYDIVDPAFNIEAGTAYLAYLLKRFDGDRALALAAYHTGPTRVARWVARGDSLPAYSRRYVRDVLAATERLRSGPPGATDLQELDRAGLRALLRAKLYGPRGEFSPAEASSSSGS